MSKKKEIYIGYSLLFLLFVLMIIRSRYGFDQTDESYYYALAKRICLGDRPIIDEWYPSQFSSILLCPFYMIYTFFIPSGTGIILAGRITYCIIALIVAIAIMRTFKEEGFAAVVSAAFFMMCARENIMGLSYYKLYAALGITISLLFIKLLKKYNTVKKDINSGIQEKSYRRYFAVRWFAIGVVIGLATICMPYLIFFIFCTCVYMIMRKKGLPWIYLLGIGVVGISYLCFILYKTNITYFIDNIKYVLTNSDYASNKSVDKFNYTWYFLKQELVWGIPGVVYLFYRLIGKRLNKRDIWITLLVCFIPMTLLGGGLEFPGAAYNQLTFLGMPLLLVRGQDEIYKVYRCLYAFGIVWALIFWMASDTGASCLCTGLVISSMAVIFMGNRFDSKNEEKDIKIVKVILFACIVMVLAKVRLISPIYRDADIDKLTCKLAIGPAAGIYTEEKDARQYTEVVNELISLEQRYPDKSMTILYSKFLPWAYLVTDYQYGTYTPWRFSIDSLMLHDYYELHPEKYPDIVVVFSPEIGHTNGFGGGEAMNKDNRLDGELWESINSPEYDRVKSNVADVFVSKTF